MLENKSIDDEKETNKNKLLANYDHMKGTNKYYFTYLEALYNAKPKMLFKELWNHSKPHFNSAKNLDGLLVVNHYEDENSKNLKRKLKR